MAFIRDSINVKVFLITILVAVAMVSLLVVFQKNFEDINSRYSTKLEELNTTFERLSNVETELNRTAENLEIGALREDDLRDKYGDLKEERDDLAAEKIRLMNEVEEKTEEISTLEIQVAIKDDEIADLNSRIEDLRSRIDCFEDGGTAC